MELRANRKFQQADVYFTDKLNSYNLLPFKFHRLNDSKEIIVNEVGDLLIVPNGTVEKIVHRNLSEEKDKELYADLISNFIISKYSIDPLIDIMATRYRTKKSFLDDFTGLHIFVMTLRCNHSCQYCQVSRVSEDKETFDMSVENLDRAISIMMKSPNPNITMEFQGGEPLITFSQIKYAVLKTEEEAKLKSKNITFVICTNVSIINEEILQFCKDHNILISTSLDGPEFIHNANRRKEGNNSYEATIKGIQLCREYLGHDRVSALMTTSPLSLQYPEEIVEEYIQSGFRDIFLRPISPYGYAHKNFLSERFHINKFLKFYKAALNKIIRFNLDGNIFIEDYAKIILEKILTPFPIGFVDLMSPAGLINNVVVFNYDGKVYASDESRMLAEMNDKTFLLGDLSCDSYDEIFHGETAIRISEVWSNESLAGCSDCAYQAYCGADPVRYHATQGDMYGFRPSSDHCVKNMEIITHLIQLMDQNKEIEKIFHSWIS